MIRIMIVDDQPLIRDGLAMLLNLREELEVVGTANDGGEALEKAKMCNPEIVLMDIRMPGTNGVEGTRLLLEQLPAIQVLMLTTFKDSELIFKALEQGASGYLLKDMSTDMIVQAILTVKSGGLVLPQEVTARVLQELKKTTVPLLETVPISLKLLTEREMDILREIGYGHNNKEIANKLFITEGTVKNHVSNLISKLELRDRTQAAIFAVRYGIAAYI